MNLFKFFPGWFQNVSLDCSLERREIAFQLFQEAEIQQNWQIPRIQVFQAWPFPFPVLSSDVFVFRFISLCGKERNFVRCDDRPIVFHNSKILPTPSGMVAINLQKANPKWDRRPGTFLHVLLKRTFCNTRRLLAPFAQPRWWEIGCSLPATTDLNGAQHRYY